MSVTDNDSSSSEDYEPKYNDLIKLEIDNNIIKTRQINGISLINQSNQPPNDISNWLIKNQTSSQYIFFLGFLYYNGIIVKKDNNNTFNLFLKTSEDNYPLAQVYLSKCHQTEIGTEVINDLALYWCEKATENGNNEDGIDFENDLDKAFKWYKNSALENVFECYKKAA